MEKFSLPYDFYTTQPGEKLNSLNTIIILQRIFFWIFQHSKLMKKRKKEKLAEEISFMLKKSKKSFWWLVWNSIIRQISDISSQYTKYFLPLPSLHTLDHTWYSELSLHLTIKVLRTIFKA